MKLKYYEEKWLHKLLTHLLIRCRESLRVARHWAGERRLSSAASPTPSLNSQVQPIHQAKPKGNLSLTAPVFPSLKTLLSGHKSLKLASRPCPFCLSPWTFRLSHNYMTPGKADLRCKHKLTMHITQAHTVGDDKAVFKCAGAQESRESFSHTFPF